MNDSLKIFVCKSENIKSHPINADIIYSISGTEINKNDITFSWITEVNKKDDIFIIRFEDLQFRDDKCEIKYDSEKNELSILDKNFENKKKKFLATIYNINKGI